MPIPMSDWLPVSGPSRPILQTLCCDARTLPWAATAGEVMSRVTPKVRASFFVKCRTRVLILGRLAAACAVQARRPRARDPTQSSRFVFLRRPVRHLFASTAFDRTRDALSMVDAEGLEPPTFAL